MASGPKRPSHSSQVPSFIASIAALRGWHLRRMLRRMRAAVVVCAILLCACQSADRVPTWHRDVRSIVTQSCTTCHTAGTIAPFALESYIDVYGRRSLIRDQVASRKMPPWPPASGCGEYADDRSLSDADRSTLP